MTRNLKNYLLAANKHFIVKIGNKPEYIFIQDLEESKTYDFVIENATSRSTLQFPTW